MAKEITKTAETNSPAKENLLGLIEKYKKQNPVKYEVKKKELEAKLALL